LSSAAISRTCSKCCLVKSTTTQRTPLAVRIRTSPWNERLRRNHNSMTKTVRIAAQA
jgi:hypothetical protein